MIGQQRVRRVKRKLQTVSTYPYFMGRHSVSRCRGNKQLVNHSIMIVPGVVTVVLACVAGVEGEGENDCAKRVSVTRDG